MKRVRCPQCGADLTPPAPGKTAVETCAYCRTVVVHGATLRTLGRAVGAEAPRLTPEAWTTALTCQLCGAPLPDAATRAEPRRVRCAYCGHRARLAPGILAVLRVAATRPRALPPRLRRGVLFWTAVWVLGLFVVTPLTVWRNERREHCVVEMETGPQPVSARRSFEVPSYPQSFGSGTVRLRYELLGKADEPVCVAVRLRRGDRARQTSLIVRPDDSHRWGALPKVGAGTYKASVQASSRAPAAVRVHLESSGALSLGWIIATLNVLLWLMGLDLFRSRFGRPAVVRHRVARALVLAWLALLLAVAAFRWDPLAEEGALDPLRPMDCAAPPAADRATSGRRRGPRPDLRGRDAARLVHEPPRLDRVRRRLGRNHVVPALEARPDRRDR
ncbi:MAG: hypothetical protein JXB32_18770 [Deltaproteobacteria bacterium]|nr:hypothetical protein [Deltaproteobacteria bacterium]